MVFRKATEEDIFILTEISKNAFDTDIFVGGTEKGGPPDYDSPQWHKKMMWENHLFTYSDDNEIAGGAVLFRNGTKLFVGRIFISPKFLGKGFGKLLMQEIEDYFSDVDKFVLDTPIWNVRTNRFYPKCGYMETGRDEESVFYEKINGKKA